MSVLISFEAAFAWFMATDSRIFALTLLHYSCHRPLVVSGIFAPCPCHQRPDLVSVAWLWWLWWWVTWLVTFNNIYICTDRSPAQPSPALPSPAQPSPAQPGGNTAEISHNLCLRCRVELQRSIGFHNHGEGPYYWNTLCMQKAWASWLA